MSAASVTVKLGIASVAVPALGSPIGDAQTKLDPRLRGNDGNFISCASFWLRALGESR